MDFRIELIPISVTDVDRAKVFYGDTGGWTVDHDQTPVEGLRFVQVTPPGSACSFCFGTGLQMLPEGTAQFIQIVVADADEAHAHLTERGVDCSGVQDLAWGRFVSFEDPDGNKWALQQVPRLCDRTELTTARCGQRVRRYPPVDLSALTDGADGGNLFGRLPRTQLSRSARCASLRRLPGAHRSRACRRAAAPRERMPAPAIATSMTAPPTMKMIGAVRSVPWSPLWQFTSGHAGRRAPALCHPALADPARPRSGN